MKKLSLLFLLCVAAISPQARTLSPQEALARISGIPQATRGSHDVSVPSHTFMTESGNPAIYLFNSPDSRIALIVSADDTAYPLLGYCDTACDADSMPPQMKWWLEEYTRQIEYATANNAGTIANANPPARKAMTPLLKSTWNQMAPFNLFTPEINGQKTPTGCVATAMAQVMNFWKYPEAGTGSVSVTLSTGKTDVLNLRQLKFDWDNMLDSYLEGNYDTKQAEAVATLMKACGYASDMNYAPGGSGAVTTISASAFFKNFKYNPNIQYYSRNYFPASEWDEMVYNELAAGRPVMYGGQSTSVGHSFVCDGYDGNGYYHFNWGWGGMSDGYFLLDALNPYAVGTGGGAGGGYNFDQDIIAGVQPDPTAPFTPRLSQFGNLSATSSGNTFNLTTTGNGWMNTGVQPIEIDFGVGITPAESQTGTNTKYVSIRSGKIDPPKFTKRDGATYVEYSGMGSGQRVTMPEDLPDGRYIMNICTRPSGNESAEWDTVLTTQESYPYVFFVKNGSSYTIENQQEASICIVDAEIISPLYYGCATKMKVTARNNSGKTLTQALYPILSASGSNQMLGEGIMMTVDAGETETEEFTTVFELLDGASAPSSRRNYTLRFIDPATSEIVAGDNGEEWQKRVTMNINLATPDVTLTGMDMPGLSKIDKEFDGLDNAQVYQVYNKNVLEFSCTLTNNRGFFGYPVYGAVFESDNLSKNIGLVELSPTPALAQNESASLSGSLEFPQGEQGKVYVMAPFALIDNSLKQLSSEALWFFEIIGSGVNSTHYDRSGMVVSYDKADSSIHTYGVSVLRIFDSNGNIVTETSCNPAGESTVGIGDLSHGIFMIVGVTASGKMRSIKIFR